MRTNELKRRKGRASSSVTWWLAGVMGLWAALAGYAQTSTLQLSADSTAAVQARPVAAERMRTRHFLRGRQGTARVSAAAALDAARRQHAALLRVPGVGPVSAQSGNSLSTAWTAVGPMQVASQGFGSVSGRVTSVVIDPADSSGNTVYVGTTGGGVWKSTNAAGAASSVTFAALTDSLPVFSTGTTASLSIGSVALGNGVLLAGTGDPNDATDSYYGAGILRSGDGGVTWTVVQYSLDGVAGNHSFFGLSTAGLAFSTSNPSLVVAAMGQAVEGDLVNAQDQSAAVKGLYYSSDAGVTWHMASLMDGSQTVQAPTLTGLSGGGNAATAVVWNGVRQKFYAAIRYHGYYESVDGMTWTRLVHQPGTGLTSTACPTDRGTTGSTGCPIFRGALAVQPVTGDMFALTVDGANRDQGLYQDVCALNGTSCANTSPVFANALNAAPLESGSAKTIAQGDYNLALAASASGTDTLLYAGTIDLYRCSLAGGCVLRNTTNAQNGCLNSAKVSAAQHAVATLAQASGPLLFVGNDGGIWRSTDGVNETGSVCSLSDASHFQNLNGGIGSLAEVSSFAQDPGDAGILLAGLGALGTAGTGAVTNAWPQLATGEGGTVAIDQTNPLFWYVSTGAGVTIARCAKGSSCAATDFGSNAIGAAQVANDVSAIHAPWLLDPGLDSNMLVGTCRAWRGAATGGALWSSSNAISRPFGAPSASGCSATFPVVRSLAEGGVAAVSSNAQNAGSGVVYAGLAGTQDGGQGFGGHVFVTTAANLASNATVWSDVALSSVTNDVSDGGLFNPGGFDVSSVTVDPHDATGHTVYATVMGFGGNGVNAPHVYRSLDAGAHWTNISSNLPNAPANSLVVDPNDANTLYVAMDTGVYVTTQVTSCTSGNCWSVFGTTLPNAPVVALAAAAGVPTGDGRTGELRAATYGRGIWQIPLLTALTPAAALISINPASVTFSAQAIGTASTSVSVTVTNTGSAPLTISSVSASGDFTETDTCVGIPVAQGASCTVKTLFLPTATGARTGLLTVYGNVAGGQGTASLSGTGTPAAAIVLNPVMLVFPSTSVGATSSVENVTISNTGGTSANLQVPVVTGDFHLAANTCGSALAPSTGCTVSIAFSPSSAGTRTGTLTVVDDAGTQVTSLSGVATSPATDALSLAGLSFAPQQLNTASTAQQVMLINAGDVALTLIAAQITNGDFAVVNGCGNSLNAHASCALSVSFSPKSLGSQTGVLTVSDQFRTQTIALSGTGLAPPGVSLAPVGGLAFGSVGVATSGGTQTVTLTNNGGVLLGIASIVVTGDFSIVAGGNTCGQTLAPAAACSVQIGFTPTVTGSRTGTVTFSDNAGNSPQILQLTGTGVDFSITPDGPTSLTIASGQSATYLLLLNSASGLSGSTAFTCAGAPLHSICTVNPANAALGATTVVTVTVATGLASASLTGPPMPWKNKAVWVALLLPVSVFFGRRRRGAVRLLSLLGCAVLLALSGCAAGRTLPQTGTTATPIATPSGKYGIVVAGSSTGLVRSVNLTLVVQ